MDIEMDKLDQEFYGALLDVIKQENSPEMVATRNLIARRIASEGDVSPSRIPAPKNITEIGGYFNLLAAFNQEGTRDRAIAGALGVAAPGVAEAAFGERPPVFFSRRVSDRPDCAQMPSLPLFFYMRSDFLESFEWMLDRLHALGAALPLYAPLPPALPPLTAAPPDGDGLLALLGRVMELAPTAFFQEPEQDPLALGFETSEAGTPAGDGDVASTPGAAAGAAPEIYARTAAGDGIWLAAYGRSEILFPEPKGEEEPSDTAEGGLSEEEAAAAAEAAKAAEEAKAAELEKKVPLDSSLEEAGWCAVRIKAAFVPIEKELNKAGWHRSISPSAAPMSPEEALRWRNVTGLIPGRSRLIDELRLLYTGGQIAGSCLREIQNAVWDGEAFRQRY